MNKKIIAASVIALGVAGIAGTAFARGPGGFGFGGPVLMRLLDDLKLSDQQELMIVQMRREAREKHKEMREARKETMQIALQELEKPNPDKARLHNLADQRIEQLRKMIHQGIDKVLALHATFTPEQRKTLVTKAHKMQERAERWKGDRDGDD